LADKNVYGEMTTRSVERFGMQRKIISVMMSDSWYSIPHCTVDYQPDVTDFWAQWLRLKDRPEWKGITFNMVVLYLCAIGLKAAPEMNAHIIYDHGTARGEIKRYADIDISMPTILPDGSMMTLNLHGCESRSLAQLRDGMEDLRRRLDNTHIDEVLKDVGIQDCIRFLKRGKVISCLKRIWGGYVGSGPIDELKGKRKREYYAIPLTERLSRFDIEQGTIMISNIGSLYRGPSAPNMVDILPPLAAGICLGSVADRPGVVTHADGTQTLEPRKFLPLLIAFDHRALDYDGMVPFCKRLDEVFANPAQLENWLHQIPE